MSRSRFWGKVAMGEGCWTWTACKQRNGYGKIKFLGKYWYAHRLAYRLFYGDIPENLRVLHRCDNRLCVRPSHLFLGTDADNIQDCLSKGRYTTGTRHPLAKLTEEDVREIRLNRKSESSTQLAAEYGTCWATMDKARRGLSWRHVSC